MEPSKQEVKDSITKWLMVRYHRCFTYNHSLGFPTLPDLVGKLNLYMNLYMNEFANQFKIVESKNPQDSCILYLKCIAANKLRLSQHNCVVIFVQVWICKECPTRTKKSHAKFGHSVFDKNNISVNSQKIGTKYHITPTVQHLLAMPTLHNLGKYSSQTMHKDFYSMKIFAVVCLFPVWQIKSFTPILILQPNGNNCTNGSSITSGPPSYCINTGTQFNVQAIPPPLWGNIKINHRMQNQLRADEFDNLST